MQLFLGIIYIWSVFVDPVSLHFSWESENVKLTSSYMFCFFVFGIVLSGKIQSMLSSSKTVLLGGALLSLGLISSSFLPSDLGFLLYITYGCIGGLGVGIGYNTIITTAQNNFPDKRGLATGISVCTFGLSTVVFTPLISYLLQTINLTNTFLVLGIGFLAITLCFFSFIKVFPNDYSALKAVKTQIEHTPKQMVKRKTFYLISLSFMFGTSVFFVINPSLYSLAESRGLSENLATTMIMLTGVCNAAGRLLFPIISDKIGRSGATLCALILTALSTLSLIFANGVLLIISVTLIALCYGGYMSIYPLLTGQNFGFKYLASTYGFVKLSVAVSSLLFPLLLGNFENPTLRYLSLSLVVVLGAILILPILKKEKS